MRKNVIYSFLCSLFQLLRLLFFLQIEGIYKKAHEAIRADPDHTKTVRTKEPVKKRWNRAKLTLSERKNRVAQKKASFLKKLEEAEA